ncbi:MAG: bifunctional diguanylate cyclase/phosphodiesterase [Actinomycetota bacterium]|nr:bifunctional diguanylate cyclase/phosphodiesterase [Actinomycetota bacterium]
MVALRGFASSWAPVAAPSVRDPDVSLAQFDAAGVAAIHVDNAGIVRATNRTWQREAAGGGLFAALRPGRELPTAAAALGVPANVLPDLLVAAKESIAEPIDLWISDVAGEAGWLYRLCAGASSASTGGTLLTCADVTLHRHTEQRLRFESTHDRLTGLADRDLLLSEIATALHASGNGQHLLLYIDLDGLKQVNDAHGHGVGDALLIEVARRLGGAQTDEIAARLGGDEFALLSPGAGGVEACLERTRHLHALLTKPYQVAGRRLLLTVSIGCRIIGVRAAETAESVLGEADEAMHQAKKAGKNGVALYSAELHERAVRRSEIEWCLGDAVGTGQIRLFYQPQVCLNTGELLAVEALLRWTSPHLGVVSPAEFVPVAESSRLILPLGAWVLNEACRQLSEWQAVGVSPASVTVNISPVQLCSPGFAESVAEALAVHGIEPSGLCLEITETALMDSSPGVVETLRALHELGVYLAIDDFGTGYSSLAQLRELPVELLKIDQSFIAGVDVDGETAGIVTAVLNLAHVLGMYVVAEGVETDGQTRELILRGCHVGQGMRFAPGVPPSEIPRLAATPFPLAADRRDRAHRRRSGGLLQTTSAGALRGAAAIPRWATGRGCRGMLAECAYQFGLPEEDR